MVIAITANTGLSLNEDEQEHFTFAISYRLNLSFWYVMRSKSYMVITKEVMFSIMSVAGVLHRDNEIIILLFISSFMLIYKHAEFIKVKQ